jgi:DNA-binding response OmpR family regulator
MSGRVLLTEDDPRIRAAMRLVLEEEGYSVAEAASGERATETFAAQPADVVLVDVMLPGMSGFDLCRKLRESSDVPIIMVTARSDTADVVKGLEAGADDYVTKPFVPKELLARIAAALRRSRTRAGSGEIRMAFGDLEVLPDQGVVRRAGEELHLSKTEFRLLCELAARPGDVFSRESLLSLVWGYDYFGDGRLVDVHVRRLRTKVEPDPSHPRWIVTVRGLGYKLQP